MNISIMKASIKRELWEFKGMLTWIPLTLAGVFIFIPLLSLLLNGVNMEVVLAGLHQLSESEFGSEVENVFFVSTAALFVPFILVGFIVQLYYFVTCLYDERRDQSVMFWRSLPVSDTVAIACKAVTGAVIIPAIFYSAATILLTICLVLGLVASSVLSVGFDISLWNLWSYVNIVSTLGSIWLMLVPVAIWLLPLYAWLMLMSIYAKKAPFLWAVLPIVAVLIIEGIVVHYLQLSQPFFGQFVGDYFSITPENSVSLDLESDSFSPFMMVKEVLGKIDYRTVLVSSGLLFATYWFRVNQQDT